MRLVTYNDVIKNLEQTAQYDLRISLSKGTDQYDDEIFFALVTVNDKTCGFISRVSLFDALNTAANKAMEDSGADDEAVGLLRAAIDEVGFDRAIELLEQQR